MAYYLGIDGGGSKTTCAVGDETRVLGTATTGPSNLVRVGEARARESLLGAVREACVKAGIDPQQVRHACIGAAGAAREEVAGAIRKIIGELIPQGVEVVGDMEIALQAAFGEGPGVIVIAGTGSIAYGRDAEDHIARAGGWGFAISDEGSAHWIGRQAIAVLLRRADENLDAAGLESSALFREVAAAWKIHSLAEIAKATNSAPDFAALLPVVVAAFDNEDEIARRVMAQASEELARLASIIVRRLFVPRGLRAESEIPMAMVGGVFRLEKATRERFAELVQTADSRVRLKADVVEPVHGALDRARRAGRS